MTNKFIIEEIQKRTKISDYLAERNILPVKVNPEKMLYRCPLPSHKNDNTPSFSIYDKGDHEDYFCYGCKSGGSLIQFIVEFEEISFRDAISRLTVGLDIDLSNVMDRIIEEVIKANQGKTEDHQSVLQTVMHISSLCHDYFLKTNKSWEEILVFEKMFKLCDNFMKSRDKKMLEELSDLLPKYMSRRYQIYTSKKEQEENREIVRWSKV